MELRHLRYFLAVAEEGNFTRAAARLGIGQPPLSQQIRDLETEIGAPLFHRVPHGAELTEAGRAFRAGIQRIPEQVAGAMRDAQRAARGETGSLRIGFVGSTAISPLFPGIIRAFRRAYPAVALTLAERNSAALGEAVKDGSLDIAFLRPDALDLGGLTVHPLADEEMVAALPANHPALAERDDGMIDLLRLKDDPFMLTPRSNGPTVFDAAVAACRAAGFEPILGQAAPQMNSLLMLVAAELGVSIVLASLRQVSLPGVAFRAIADARPVARLALVHPKAMSPAIRNFVAAALHRRGGEGAGREVRPA
ncbi:LysR family transcriptional regulator [Aureimonas endophytica]|uniref:LysR family transcriptional regulator n=1 Tax=Aureimonas endophytica TaxID=2027858 RepID=A0A916ZTR0_9HYPH|nr:LysR family transcriptional regulator [Aureimonas endophytica]GGE13800.1 LysR family transcriptional regulator [Aureimonas endophytica]